ncbi:MAG: hypothetical protein ACRDH8_12905 [Actinomycetota bacterium]
MLRRLRALAARASVLLRRRSLWSSLLELAGFGLITGAAYRYSLTVALLVGGVFLVLISYGLAGPSRPRR